MKKLTSKTLVALLGIFVLAMAATPPAPSVEIGEVMPAMQLPLEDVSGTEYNLRELHQENGLLVIFSCNTCPFVLQWEDRYNDLYELCDANDIGMVLVNSNEAKRNGDDSMEMMKKKAEKEGYLMPYVVDTDHVVADAFGAKTTPHVFLFDASAKLFYRGLIDDNGEDKSAVNQRYLENAINNMLTGVPADPEQTKSIGCSIKRVN